MTEKLTLERLRECLSYDPDTGIFTWRIKNRRPAIRSVAGTISVYGYRIIEIDGAKHRASRLAWFYMTGEWPTKQVDHRNMVRDDDRFANLREATQTQNLRNTRMRRDNTAGYKGVHLNKRNNRWRAFINVEGRQRYLGSFDTAAQAHAAYCNAAMEIDPEFARAA